MVYHTWVLVTALLGGDTPRAAVTIEPYVPIPVAVDRGTATIDLPAGAAPQNYLVLLGALGSHEVEVTIRRARAENVQPIQKQPMTPDASWTSRVQSRRKEMERQRARAASASEHTAARFAERRPFYLFVRDGDFHDPRGYQEVQAVLAAVGRHCIIYVDEEDAPSYPSETIGAIVSMFDNDIYPGATRLFGHHRDVDRNGKFTILVTHWLGQLSSGKVSLGGFVRGGDFHTEVEAPFSNQCDMMYLNSDLKPGAHLRNILAHEYTHAITFSEHVFGQYLKGEGGVDDDGWLSEAMAHMGENLLGTGWSNLDYRISTFLTRPARYRLVVTDYYRAGLWRCHGCRGATFLFLRWCVDRHGVGILRELSRSSLTGIDNLEAATQTPFAELFRGWSVSLSLDGVSPDVDRKLGLESLDLRSRLSSRLLAGPQYLMLDTDKAAIALAPTSFCPVRIDVHPDQPARITVEAPANAQLQVTLIRLTDEQPVMRLNAVPIVTLQGESYQAQLSLRQESGKQVRWDRVTWERAVLPQTKSGDDVNRAEVMRFTELFPSQTTAKGEVLLSDPINVEVFRGAEVVFKMVGTDEAGRRVTAWTTLDLRPQSRN